MLRGPLRYWPDPPTFKAAAHLSNRSYLLLSYVIAPSRRARLTTRTTVRNIMSEQPRSSLYRSLNPIINEIRLLTSFQIDAEDRVTCRLITVSLQDCPSYTALSSVWGGVTDPVSIQVDGQDFQATPNLALALRYLPRHWQAKYLSRPPSTELRVWADAVCINQCDLEERAGQVQLMGGIFSGAELVICWVPDGFKQLPRSTTLNPLVMMYRTTC